ncbi:hypothetical protein U1Q18_015215 [Sarracenia purpurea var. burkii]
MRIRKFLASSVSAASTSSASLSSLRSSITNNSFNSITSSKDSSSSTQPNSLSSSTRCEGLDLLIKAIHHVSAGSAVGVPYIQRRVIRRRRRAQRFNRLIITQLFNEDDDVETEERETKGRSEPNSIRKHKRRVMALPFKYHDSIL